MWFHDSFVVTSRRMRGFGSIVKSFAVGFYFDVFQSFCLRVTRLRSCVEVGAIRRVAKICRWGRLPAERTQTFQRRLAVQAKVAYRWEALEGLGSHWKSAG